MSRIATSLILTVLLASNPLYAQEKAVTVAEYLQKWDAMDAEAMRKEMQDTGTLDTSKYPEFVFVQSEIEKTARAFREAVEAGEATGTSAQICLPEEGKGSVSSDTLIPHLQSYENPSEVTLAVAFADLMAKTYPCE